MKVHPNLIHIARAVRGYGFPASVARTISFDYEEDRLFVILQSAGGDYRQMAFGPRISADAALEQIDLQVETMAGPAFSMPQESGDTRRN